MPSAKYALSGSRLRFSNGKTATLLSGMGAGTSEDVPTDAEAPGTLLVGGQLRYRIKIEIARLTIATAKMPAVHSQPVLIFGVAARASKFAFTARRSASISAI